MDSEAEAIRFRDLKSPMLRGSLTGVYENVRASLLSVFHTFSAEAHPEYVVSPCSAISIPEGVVHIVIPPDSRHAPVLVHVPNRQFRRRQGRTRAGDDARA